uniref:Major capsid protein n=1 Tax=Myoviridae sp. ctXho31 TaxID=2825122 RepID=A0A8S5TWT4_9CAUD|nr:MAG TPA: major capsid protein [Myoviridae sp. ctXho31]
MTLKEIEKRKAELLNKIAEAKTQEELTELRKEVEAINKEVPEQEETEEKKDGEIRHEEERSLIADTQEIEQRNLDTKELKVIKEEKEMEEKRKFTIADKEYRSAWAKKLMGLKDEKFTEDEKRALGDAVTTTATTFVASTESVQGINNGGLFIPTSVREDLMEIIEKNSPIFRDVRKLQVAGNIDLPYLFDSDDAEWYVELTDTKNEGQEYRSLQLTGWELAKDIVITWKLEAMAVESFISFLLEELANKMGKALINAVIYGDGANKPTGITKGLTAIKTGTTPIDNIINTYETLSDDARIGAKAYVSTSVKVKMISYKDENGNYPFLQGINGTDLFSIETDPYLKNNDVVVGNCRNYILNEVAPMSVAKESTVKGRKTTYGGYGIYDGKARPNYFAYGQYTPSV